ncbi:hypothetical protein EIP86_008356 [Pleurotus ostreatoroseus]|nr:hypothetical protein EIP86_008356 [Pleurotus ostreatoroseus]
MAATPRVELNLDVLKHTLSLVDKRSDLLALMRSCHALYAAGIQPLVRLPIVITNQHIRSFHAFMLAHSPMTFVAFTSFDFFVWNASKVSDADIPLLTELLKRGINLRRLRLDPGILEDHTDLCKYIAELTKLEDLDIQGEAYDAVHLILARLQSPLTTLHVWFEDDDFEDPVPLLANFRHTLQKANISYVRFGSVEIRYPMLTELEVDTCDPPALSVLTTAVPNLKKLRIDTGGRFTFLGTHTEELDQLRADNIAFQEDGNSWSSLVWVTGDITALYAMALQHQLNSLSISSVLKSLSEDDVHRLQDVLSTTKTHYLTLVLADNFEHLPQVFAGIQGPLLHLDLTLSFYNNNGYDQALVRIRISDLSFAISERRLSQDNFIKGISPIRTCMLHLKLADYRGLYTAASHPAITFLNQTDKKKLINRIANSCSMVECIVLDIQGSVPSFWMEMKSGTLGEKTWTELKQEDFEKAQRSCRVDKDPDVALRTLLAMRKIIGYQAELQSA